MLKFLKTKVEVETDVTTTEEVQVALEATEILVVNAEVVAEVSDHVKKAVSAAKEVQTDQEEKADAENRVLSKEKTERQDVLKVLIDRPDARLKRQKIVNQEEASFYEFFITIDNSVLLW